MKIPKKFYPYRIPYQGSKQSIAFKLMMIMAQKCPNAKYFFDVFGGGGAMSYAAAQFGLKVFYSDINQGIVNLHNFLKNNEMPTDWFRWIPKEEYFERCKKTDPFSVAVTHTWAMHSWAGEYIYNSKKIYPIQYHHYRLLLHKDLSSLRFFKEALGFNLKLPKANDLHQRICEFSKYYTREQRDASGKAAFLNIQPFERLFVMRRLCKNRFDITFEAKDYADIDLSSYSPSEVIIYCDPPYQETASYLSGKFDRLRFNRWFAGLSCPAFISEFKSDFKELASFEKKTGVNRTSRKTSEKLFWNGK